jgi:hypothetical protein
MKLTTVLGSVNLNPNYYLFIPKQIKFWGRHGIRFIAVIAGDYIPKELLPYSANIFLWKKNKEINSVFLGQHLRIYYPALLDLPDDELCMITDMDMLPIHSTYFKNDIEQFTSDDWIYYNKLIDNQIIMCYNAANPKTWSNVFNIKSEDDIESRLRETYDPIYEGKPSGRGWFSDQEIMYKSLINNSNLKVLNKPIKRLETWDFRNMIKRKNINLNFDDIHFHRSFQKNIGLISFLEKLLKL